MNEKQNFRSRTVYLYNLDLYRHIETTGIYDMPVLAPEPHVPDRLTGFNYALSGKDYGSGVHFYLDDYQFERIWRDPIRYMNILKRFDCVLQPDFSIYRDMPYAMKIWNCYRSKLLAAIWQQQGLKVIPTVRFCDTDTYDYCFDGMPQGGTYVISSQGIIRDKEARRIWYRGIEEWLKHVTPGIILFYGENLAFDFGKIEVRSYKNHVTETVRRIVAKKEK